APINRLSCFFGVFRRFRNPWKPWILFFEQHADKRFCQLVQLLAAVISSDRRVVTQSKSILGIGRHGSIVGIALEDWPLQSLFHGLPGPLWVHVPHPESHP